MSVMVLVSVGSCSNSRKVMSRRPTPFRRREQRATALGACRVSDRSLSSLRIAMATMAMTPAMTPVPNAKVIPAAIAITMRSITASRILAGSAYMGAS
jgi:hypothetical protein